MKRIGLMGGTFSPIHNGHIKMAEAAYKEFKLDEVWFIPTGNSYLKSDVLSAEYRYKMTELAIKDIPYFKINDIEVKRGKESYSYETITELKAIYPDYEFFFIVGSDSLVYMDKWKRPELIFDNVTILVAPRNSVEYENTINKAEEFKKSFKAEIKMLNMEKIDVSSTDIRKMIKEGKSVKDFLANEVLDYIKTNNLYRD